MTVDAPLLDGIHHVKLPVSDLRRSREWYETRLGYQVTEEFTEDGVLMGIGLSHPRGGPGLALRLAPEKARAAAGFDYFSIGVPTKAAMDDLAERLTSLGDAHAGVHFASIGWILPEAHDPDGHEVRFYTTQHHTETSADDVLHVNNARETAQRREDEMRASQGQER